MILSITITDVKAIATAPARANLVVVKVETSEPGLYGLGCATYTQRWSAVVHAVETYMKPLCIGRDVDNIEDMFQQAWQNSYWRNGPVLNNAISGVDQALWDIKGKRAGMPVYQLLGGKSRTGAAIYRHADGSSKEEVLENVQRFMAEGVHHVRVQMGGYGGRDQAIRYPENPLPGTYYDPDIYARMVPDIFEHVRSHVGYGVELLHDVHERLNPIETIRLAKNLEQYRLFFLEDSLAPEQVGWFKQLRNQVTIPLAMGELFNNPMEWLDLIKERQIDFIRVHISQIGGLTPARKLASLCEAFGIRTAWHGPPDVSPVGHAVNLHLDYTCANFGIQEWSPMNEVLQEVFPGTPLDRNGYAYLNEAPGIGVDIDEKLAAKYPCVENVQTWTQTRLPDGTSVKP